MPMLLDVLHLETLIDFFDIDDLHRLHEARKGFAEVIITIWEPESAVLLYL